MCKSVGFNLIKFVSNSKELLQLIPKQQKCQGTKNQGWLGDLPADKAFSIKVKLDGKSLSKWTMLSMVSSIFDPLGFPAPFVPEGREILQSLCNHNLPWNMEVNDEVRKNWNKFVTKLKHVDELYLRRCIRPDEFR